MANWSKTIKLASGGAVTIDVSGNVLDMPEDDREFVILLVDRLTEYETDARKIAAGEEV